MSGVFLDTSALFAAARRQSDRHAEARSAYGRLLRSGQPLVTTDFVLAELHALTLARVGPEIALDLAERLAASARIEIVSTTRTHFELALELLKNRRGRRYSLADAVSFEVMRAGGIPTAFTLDADFAAEGFEVVPSNRLPAAQP